MRTPAPKPESTLTQIISDGYQVCARCGEVMGTGDTVDVVPRGPGYLVFTHQECKGGMVRGWSSVRKAEAIYRSENEYTPRLAAHSCAMFPTCPHAYQWCKCSSILDNKKLFVPKGEDRATWRREDKLFEPYKPYYEPTQDPVWYTPSDESTLGLPRSATCQDIERTFEELSEHGRPVGRNTVEDGLIAGLDRGKQQHHRVITDRCDRPHKIA